MHIRLLAVGDRQPLWVDSAFEDYVARFPRQWQFHLQTIATARRTRTSSASRALNTESENLLSKLRPAEQVIALDERGTQYSTRELADQLDGWQSAGEDIAFVIGGPDGVSPDLLQRARSRWSLSKLTLPHGLARVVFAEQMYRAWSLLTGHPYHRE